MTDTLVPFPNIPASISMVNVDYVCVIDEIGNPAKIASGEIDVVSYFDFPTYDDFATYRDNIDAEFTK